MVKKKTPFTDIDDDDKTPEPVEADPVVDMDADDDDPIDSPSATPQSRQDKRNNRAWMNREEKERLVREAEEGRAARAQGEQAILQAQQATAWAQQMARQGGQQTQRDPIDDAEELLTRERTVLNKEYQQRLTETKGGIPADEQAKFEKRALDLEGKSTQIQVQRTLRQMGMAPQDPRTAQVEAFKANLSQRYPEAVSSPQALAFAEGIQRQRYAEGKNPWSQEVIDEAMSAAEKRFGLGRFKQGAPRAPDPVLRERLAGPPRGASNGGGGEGPRQVAMTKEMRKMANASFGHIKDEGKRYKAWYQAQQSQTDD